MKPPALSGTPLASFHLTQTPYTDQGWGGTGAAERFRKAYLEGREQSFALTDDPAAADYILFCEDYQAGEQVYAPLLRAHELVGRYPEKVFVHSGEDRPLGFLPGVYCSLPRSHFDPRRHRSCAYFGAINPRIALWEKRSAETDRRWLFSFMGAPTAPVRTALFQQYQTNDRWFIRETGNQQFNVGVDDPAKAGGQDSYLETLLQSDFVLCPRGYGTSSFRLFETMRLGRVPVILADEWIAPEGPTWSEFSIRVGETRTAGLPDLLARYQPRAAEMGRLARLAWERWFAPEIYVARCLEAVHELALARSHREADCFAHWPSLIAARQRAERGGVSYPRHLARCVKARLSRIAGR